MNQEAEGLHCRDGYGAGSGAERIRCPVIFFGSRFGSGFEFLGKTGAGFSLYGIMYTECM